MFFKVKSNIHYFKEVSSTMNIAKDMAKNGCPNFTVIVSDIQKQGRGRLKRSWLSQEGGLYFTTVLKDISLDKASRVCFLASYIIVQIFNKIFNIEAKTKWPNDILVDNKKICGMLSEMEVTGEELLFLNVGIGINVNNDPSIDEPKATSLKKLTGRSIDKEEILIKFLEEFELKLQDFNEINIIPQWKEHNVTINKEVTIHTFNKIFKGFAVDVDENGALILSLNDGSTQKVFYGDCFFS